MTHPQLEFCLDQNIRIVRWSLAMPSYQNYNYSIALKSYSAYMPKLLEFQKSLLRNKIISYNDCPLPFSINNGLSIYHNGIRCGTCQPPFDIYPNYIITGCMGVGKRILMDMRDFTSIAQIDMEYKKQVMLLRTSTNNKNLCLGFSK